MDSATFHITKIRVRDRRDVGIEGTIWVCLLVSLQQHAGSQDVPGMLPHQNILATEHTPAPLPARYTPGRPKAFATRSIQAANPSAITVSNSRCCPSAHSIRN